MKSEIGITVEQSPYSPDLSKIFDIHAWSKRRVADYHTTENFIVTRTHLLLRQHLREGRGGITVVVGPQGIGKTETRNWLARELGQRHVVSLVWEGSDQIGELVEKFRKKTETVVEENPNPGREGETMTTEVVSYSDDPSWIFIDFEDYSMTHRSTANNDLRDLQRFIGIQTHPPINEKTPDRDPNVFNLKSNICVFYQQELWATLKHFWKGKPKVFELEANTPAQLVEYYRELWGTPHLFTPSAILELAKMSRGIFRWFMEYIDRCLDSQMLELIDENYDIKTQTIEDIQDIIKATQIVRKWQNEFKALFPQSDENQLTAEFIMRDLTRNGKTMQQTLRKKYFDPRPKGAQHCSYVLTKMEGTGYITRTDMGQEKCVELT